MCNDRHSLPTAQKRRGVRLAEVGYPRRSGRKCRSPESLMQPVPARQSVRDRKPDRQSLAGRQPVSRVVRSRNGDAVTMS
jgi:hypothetical protein